MIVNVIVMPAFLLKFLFGPVPYYGRAGLQSVVVQNLTCPLKNIQSLLFQPVREVD